MPDDFSPTLDRYVQEDLGRAVRDRMPETEGRELPQSLEVLLEALRDCGADDRGR